MNTTEQVTETSKTVWITNHKGECMIGLIAIILLSYYILKKYDSLKEDKDLLEVSEEEKVLTLEMLSKAMNAIYNIGEWEKIKILYLEGNVLYYELSDRLGEQTLVNCTGIQNSMRVFANEVSSSKEQIQNNTNILNKIMTQIIENPMNDNELCKKLQRYIPNEKQYKEKLEKELVIDILQKYLNKEWRKSFNYNNPQNWYDKVKSTEPKKDDIRKIISFDEEGFIYVKESHHGPNVATCAELTKARNAGVNSLPAYEKCIQYYIERELKAISKDKDNSKTIALLEKVAKDTKDLTLEKLQRYIPNDKKCTECRKNKEKKNEEESKKQV